MASTDLRRLKEKVFVDINLMLLEVNVDGYLEKEVVMREHE